MRCRTVILLTATGWLASVVAASSGEGTLFPKGLRLASVVSIDMRNLNEAQRVMVSTLQGNVAKKSTTQIFMDEGGVPWRSFLTSRYGIPVTIQSDPWVLLRRFGTNIDGYILYDKVRDKDSVNSATSLCGPYNAIAVDATIEPSVRAAGITNMVLDVRGRDEKWVYDNYRTLFNPMLGAELSEDIDYHLRDYAVMANAFAFYDSGILQQQILNDWPEGGALMGYTDVSIKGEYGAFVPYAQRGIAYLGANLAANLSLLSSIYDSTQYQKSHPPDPVVEPNVHYVTFVMSDGDNVSYDLWSGYFQFASSNRGKFNMGWPMLASMVDYAPSVLRWYYENASELEGRRDNFIAQGGIVGTYFSSWPANRLDLHVLKVNEFMAAADMRVLVVIDYNAFDHLDVWDKFTYQSKIDGVIYNNYGGPATGRVLFSNGKPIVDIRDVLWQGVEDSTNLAARVNSYARDPSRATGYTAVLVHTWSQSLSDVQAAINAFASAVRVVTPEEFIKLVRKNLRPIPNDVRIVTTNGALKGAETTVVSGGTVAFAQGVNYTQPDRIVLNGGGAAGWQGALDLDDGSAVTFDGPIDLGSNGTIGSGVSGGTITLNGLINTTTNAHDLTLKGNGTTVVNGAITGGGRVACTGSGSKVLAVANAYLGGTIVNSGTLSLMGSVESTVTVNGGVFNGNGTIKGDVVVNGGVHALGTSNGAMTIEGNYALNPSGMLRIEINGPTVSTQGDQIRLATVGGTVTLGGALEIIATNDLALGIGFIIITNVGTQTVIGTFAGKPQNHAFFASGYWWRINYSGGDGNNLAVTLIAPPAPHVDVALIGDNTTQLRIRAEANHTVQIQASIDLVNWATLLATNSPVSSFDWSRTNTSNFPMQFYRVVLLP